MGKAREHLPHDIRWTWWWGVVCTLERVSYWSNRVFAILCASFLQEKSSTVDLANVWGLGYQWSARWWSLVARLFECSPLPPYIHLTTWHHSCDKCSQAFVVFCRFSASVYYYTEHKLKNKNGGGLGTRLHLLYICNHLEKRTKWGLFRLIFLMITYFVIALLCQTSGGQYSLVYVQEMWLGRQRIHGTCCIPIRGRYSNIN